MAISHGYLPKTIINLVETLAVLQLEVENLTEAQPRFRAQRETQSISHNLRLQHGNNASHSIAKSNSVPVLDSTYLNPAAPALHIHTCIEQI